GQHGGELQPARSRQGAEEGLQPRPPGGQGQVQERPALQIEEVEGDQPGLRRAGPGPAGGQALLQAADGGPPVLQDDQLPVQDEGLALGQEPLQPAQLGKGLGEAPAPAAEEAGGAVHVGQTAEAIPLHLVEVLPTLRNLARKGQHGLQRRQGAHQEGLTGWGSSSWRLFSRAARRSETAGSSWGAAGRTGASPRSFRSRSSWKAACHWLGNRSGWKGWVI